MLFNVNVIELVILAFIRRLSVEIVIMVIIGLIWEICRWIEERIIGRFQV